MFKRNLDNLKKFLTLTEEKDLKCGLIIYVFDNEDQEIRTDLLVDRIMKAIQDKQKPFICHTWNDQWLINIRMANQSIYWNIYGITYKIQTKSIKRLDWS